MPSFDSTKLNEMKVYTQIFPLTPQSKELQSETKTKDKPQGIQIKSISEIMWFQSKFEL